MSQYGPPPPGPDDDREPGQPGQQPDPQPGQHSGPPQGDPGAGGYNPYPDNWGSAATGNQAFNAQVPPPPPIGNPYGQPAAYGAQPPGANPYAGRTTGPDSARPTFGFGGYAGWFTRAGAYLIDYIAGLVAAAPALLGYLILVSNTSTTTNPDGTQTTDYSGSLAVPVILILIGAVTGIAFFVWNICLRQGRTGASIGKSVLAIRLVNSDLQPIGSGWSFLRYLLHILDGICYIGYLWPIWDSQKQTFADKIMSSYVIQATTPQERPFV
jgi:uncharacterized RDD family membrane protein YckC